MNLTSVIFNRSHYNNCLYKVRSHVASHFRNLKTAQDKPLGLSFLSFFKKLFITFLITLIKLLLNYILLCFLCFRKHKNLKLFSCCLVLYLFIYYFNSTLLDMFLLYVLFYTTCITQGRNTVWCVVQYVRHVSKRLEGWN